MAASCVVKETVPVSLGDLLDARDGAMVTLVADETRLAAHKAVLGARSPVFAAMFCHEMEETSSGVVTIPDVEGPVLRQLLEYCYTLQAPQLAGKAAKLLVAADKYGLMPLKALCEQQLVEQLSVETAATAAVLAVRHSCNSLRQAAIAFIRTHFVTVVGTQGWADAVRSQPEDVVEVSQLLAEPPGENPAQCSPATTDSRPSSGDQNQPHSDQSQTPTATALPTSARDTPTSDPNDVSHLRSLSSEEKGRRLREAAREGRVEEVGALLAAGVDVDARDRHGWTVLHCAALHGHVEVAGRLLQGGAEVDARTNEQRTPLHWAADRGHTAVVRLLLSSSANPNARDKDGITPLHLAAKYGYLEVVAALLEAGADRGLWESSGKTALDLARKNKKMHVVQLLT